MTNGELDDLFSNIAIAVNLEPSIFSIECRLEVLEAVAFKLMEGATDDDAEYVELPWEKEQTIRKISQLLSGVERCRGQLRALHPANGAS